MIFQPFPLFGKGGTTPPPTVVDLGSLRRFTAMQFAQMTAIVAPRIDRAMQDLIARYNALQPSDLGRAEMQKTYVWGYSPFSGSANGTPKQLPFVGIHNAYEQIDLVTPAQNEYRLKGTFNRDIYPNPGPDADNPEQDQLAWTNTLYFPRPVRIVAAQVILYAGSASFPNGYQNDFVYGDPPPPTRQDGDPVNDMYVSLDVDSRWYKGNTRKLAEPELQRIKFTSSSQTFSPLFSLDTGGIHIVEPEYPQDAGIASAYAVAIDSGLINVPIPEQSVARFTLMLPRYITGQQSGWTKGGDNHYAWNNQVFSLSLTVMEECAK